MFGLRPMRILVVGIFFSLASSASSSPCDFFNNYELRLDESIRSNFTSSLEAKEFKDLLQTCEKIASETRVLRTTTSRLYIANQVIAAVLALPALTICLLGTYVKFKSLKVLNSISKELHVHRPENTGGA